MTNADIDYGKHVPSQICRACLKPELAGRSLFDGDPSYFNLLKNLTGCRVELHDMLPDILCNFCAASLNSLSEFVKLCRESEQRLQSMMEENSLIKIKIEPVVRGTDDELYHTNNEDFSDDSEDVEENMNKTLTCKICSKVFRHNSAMIDHVRKHTGEKPFICDHCNRGFALKGTLVRHMTRVHIKCDKLFTCETCGKQTSNRTALKIHMRTHTKEKPYKCSVCSMSFTQTGSLQSHKLLHTGERPNVCSVCGKGFVTKNQLKRHMTVHSDERKFKCHLCEKCFKTKDQMKHHVSTHSSDKPHVCCECGASFTVLMTLKNHTKARHSELSGRCKECNKHFSNLRDHMRVHTGETPFACSECGKKFPLKRSLAVHMQKHKCVNKHKCNVDDCDKTFSDAYNLEYHNLRYHQKIAPFVCEICPRKFYRSSDLKIHVKSCSIKSGHFLSDREEDKKNMAPPSS